ncbi:tRNA dihydrouridine synthase DusB, partial [Candidatus Parcubacteria bacterium]|nr:tRNA dihydrouridine synthase DusB [Candidatus Parcubacteria bacterium]
MKLDWKTGPRPIVALSPMADMTDSAFCRTVRAVSDKAITLDGMASRPLSARKNQTVVFREMVSAEAVVRGNEKTLGMTDIHPDERPIVQQLFGNDPDTMAEAARIIEAQHHPEGFDVNMGCPVYKIVHQFNGASLMREPERAADIVRKMKAAITVPLSIKIRTGWDDPTQCFAFARVLEEAGADLITMHGRTKIQGYSGDSDWNRIAELKERVAIPVLANGDIHTAPLALQALETTGADGVLIARGALGNPWVFRQIFDLLGGRTTQAIGLCERVETIKTHLRFHTEQYGERGVVTFRKHLSWYLRGMDGTKPYKERLHRAVTVGEVEA